MEIAIIFRAFTAVLSRDIRLALRHRSELLNPLLFFLIVVTMFPLALGPDKLTLQAHAPAVIWVAAVLASSISLDLMFRSDFDDGSLEQLLLSPCPDTVLVMAKILAHWLLTGAPLTVFAMLLSIFLYLPGAAVLPLYMPVLIFAVAGVNNTLKGLSVYGEIYILAAMLILAATLCPFATASSLKIRMG